VNDIFKYIKKQHQGLQIWISFYEIYCGKLHDLLNDRQQLFVRECALKKVNIVGLIEKKVDTVDAVMSFIHFGNSVRVMGVTGANADSSRSHAILQITIKKGDEEFGKMSFIDLAGSERAADVTD